YFQEDPNHPVNQEINLPITETEIIEAVRSLKRNKSPGIDDIMNEHIINTLSFLLPVYVKLFNIIFDHSIIPENWLLGNILPIYKNKGDIHNPENYRPISLLSCLGKLFTTILNNRLSKYAESFNVLTDCQAGFRKGHSTADNLFIINSLIEIFKSKREKLFLAFVDFKQAFDTVWRDGLWQKLRAYHINGKCLSLIQNLYNNIKSRITTSEGSSIFFPCSTGVRQGESLSPFLFSIYLNDLEYYFSQKTVPGINCEFNDDEILIYFKLFILLYADDTVIFGDNAENLQNALNSFEEYCNIWRLTVNVTKTKILIISQGRPSSKQHFYFNNTELEIVKEYKYLGIFLSRSGTFITAKKYISEQANKALFSLIKKIRNLNLPFDIQIDLFNKTIKPILLYGCEIWGTGNCDIIERVQLKFYKYIFNLKKTTPSFMIYGELGITPIILDIKSRIISFWTKLTAVNDETKTLSSLMYDLVYQMHKNSLCRSNYLDTVKHIIDSCGFSGIWQTQNPVNPKWFKLAIKQKINDQFLQQWSGFLDNASSGTNYRLFKDNPKQSNYISALSSYYCKIFIAFRTRNHKLPVETGRWASISLKDRICHLCNADIGDEYHYIMSCKYFKSLRSNYIKNYYYINPNTIKFKQLMNVNNRTELRKLCMFIKKINETVG
ncbi:MAG: reverse transcriptase family protein, partial [Candidatus Thiodiazotropha sp.]